MNWWIPECRAFCEYLQFNNNNWWRNFPRINWQWTDKVFLFIGNSKWKLKIRSNFAFEKPLFESHRTIKIDALFARESNLTRYGSPWKTFYINLLPSAHKFVKGNCTKGKCLFFFFFIERNGISTHLRLSDKWWKNVVHLLPWRDWLRIHFSDIYFDDVRKSTATLFPRIIYSFCTFGLKRTSRRCWD